MGFTDSNVRDLLAYFGIADDPVAGMGISGADGSNDQGVYDDRFYFSIHGAIHTYRGNVDPSRLVKGRATLAPMRVFHWRAGIHGLSKPAARRYAAFVQAEEVTVLRYKQGADTGWFGINHHRGGATGTSSLGCQTYPPEVWEEARARLYDGIGATVPGIGDGTKRGRPFPYVVVPRARAREILAIAQAGGQATAAAVVPRSLRKAPTWTIRLKGKPGEADEVYDRAINIGGRVFVPVRDFCVAALDCTPEDAPLEWKDGPGDTDILTVCGKTVHEVSEINGSAYVWIAETAKAMGYAITVNSTAKNLTLSEIS